MPLIEVRGLTKLYRMGESVVHALDGVDLTIERGDFVAITGPSGSGKSTIMHVLGCLDRPTSGSYLLDGRDVSVLSDGELAMVRNQQIGFVFQTFNLINRTSALENVGIPLFYARKTNTRGPARRALEHVGLASRATHNPNELSGGERQRVAIARAIVNDPPLVMADEPTGNLDSRTGEQIIAIFRALNEQGVTIVMVTHEPHIARLARRIVSMRDGQIVSDRLTAELAAAEQPAALPEAVPAEEGIAHDPDVAQVAQTQPSVAEEAEPRDAATPVDYSAMTPRLMRGTTAALVCALFAAGLWLVAIGVQVGLSMTYDLKALSTPPANPQMPPLPVVVGGLIAFLAMIAAIVMGVLAVVLGHGARKRMRREPGNWLGRRRVITALVLGWLSVGLPVVGIAISVVRAVVSAQRAG